MATTAEQDPSRTIAAAVAGDDVAFARIVAANHEDMRRVCSYMTRDDAIAEEAVQAAWLVVWKKLATIRDPKRLRPWLVSVAVNEAKQLLRKRRRRSEVEITSRVPERPGGVDPATGIDSVDLRAALHHLDPDDRALLAMRYVAGFNATELAAAIGLSPPGTRARLQRLLARLKTELER